MKKVRYLTVSRVAIELVSKLSTEEKASFIDVLYTAFKQIESGEPAKVPEIDGVMNVIMDETITELETGFKNYRQKMTAVEKAQEKKRNKELEELGVNPSEVADISANDRRMNGDASANDIKQNVFDKKDPLNENTIGRDTGNLPSLSEKEVFQFSGWMNQLGIEIDDDVLQVLKKNEFSAIRSVVFKIQESGMKVNKDEFITMFQENEG